MLKCGLVLWPNRRQVHEGTGYVHAFPAADWTAVLNLAANRSVGRSIGGEDGQPNQAVVDENGVTRLQFSGQASVFNRKVGPAVGLHAVNTAVEGDGALVLEHVGLGKGPQANFWSREISENAGWSTEFILNVSQPTVQFGFVVWLAVRIVEPTHVNTRLEQGLQGRSVLGRRADGGHDSRASHRLTSSFVEQTNDKLINHEIVHAVVLNGHRPLTVAVGGFGVGEHVARKPQMHAVLI